MTSFSSGEHQKLNMVFGFFEKDAGLRSYLFPADSQITNGDSFVLPLFSSDIPIALDIRPLKAFPKSTIRNSSSLEMLSRASSNAAILKNASGNSSPRCPPSFKLRMHAKKKSALVSSARPAPNIRPYCSFCSFCIFLPHGGLVKQFTIHLYQNAVRNL